MTEPDPGPVRARRMPQALRELLSIPLFDARELRGPSRVADEYWVPEAILTSIALEKLRPDEERPVPLGPPAPAGPVTGDRRCGYRFRNGWYWDRVFMTCQVPVDDPVRLSNDFDWASCIRALWDMESDEVWRSECQRASSVRRSVNLNPFDCSGLWPDEEQQVRCPH